MDPSSNTKNPKVYVSCNDQQIYAAVLYSRWYIVYNTPLCFPGERPREDNLVTLNSLPRVITCTTVRYFSRIDPALSTDASFSVPGTSSLENQPWRNPVRSQYSTCIRTWTYSLLVRIMKLMCACIMYARLEGEHTTGDAKRTLIAFASVNSTVVAATAACCKMNRVR